MKDYAIIDNESNRSMAELFDMFAIQSPSSPYSLKISAGIIDTTERQGSGFQIESN